MSKLGNFISVKDLKTLAPVHRNLADALERLHHQTLEMQTAISPALSHARTNDGTLLSLQGLDGQAQMLLDLSCILHRMGEMIAEGNIDLSALQNQCILPSTAAIIFGSDDMTTNSKRPLGEVLLF